MLGPLNAVGFVALLLGHLMVTVELTSSCMEPAWGHMGPPQHIITIGSIPLVSADNPSQPDLVRSLMGGEVAKLA